MPISADRFEEIEDGEEPQPGTNAHHILSFLEEHPNQAFTQSEIVEATNIKRGSVGPTLVRLRKAGRVDHKGRYWRISDHIRSIAAASRHADAVAESHEDSPFEYDDWQEYAADPREHRE